MDFAACFCFSALFLPVTEICGFPFLCLIFQGLPQACPEN